MRSLKLLLIAASLAAVPAMAQDVSAPAATGTSNVKKGAMVYSADGRRIGRVDYIRDDAAGIIYNSRFIRIPVSTLSDAEKGIATTLTSKDISKL